MKRVDILKVKLHLKIRRMDAFISIATARPYCVDFMSSHACVNYCTINVRNRGNISILSRCKSYIIIDVSLFSKVHPLQLQIKRTDARGQQYPLPSSTYPPPGVVDFFKNNNNISI